MTEGTEMSAYKIRAPGNRPTPQKRTQVNIYLGMCNNPDTVAGIVSWGLYHGNVTSEHLLKC